MLLAAGLLALLALALAWPVPVLLAASRWPARSPALGLLAWSAIALAGGLSMIGALATFGLAPYGDDLVRGLIGFTGHLAAGTLPAAAHFWQLFALSGAILLGVHLLLNLALTAVRTERARRRHASLLALLSAPHPELERTRLLDSPAPFAYCLPGAIRSLTVLSAGLVEVLSPVQLAAVIEHERAHAQQRHHLVLVAFQAWRAALPWFPVARLSMRSVALLTEFLADDRARRRIGLQPLGEAIGIVAERLPAAPALPAPVERDHSADAARVRLLRMDAPGLAAPARLTVVSASIALLVVPTALLLAPLVA